MANFDFIKIKKIIISQGHNKLVENEPERLNDFLVKKIKVSVIKTRNCTIKLDRLPSDQTKCMYRYSFDHKSNLNIYM